MKTEEWEKEFRDFFVGTDEIQSPGRNLNLVIVKDFFRSLLSQERQRERDEVLNKIVVALDGASLINDHDLLVRVDIEELLNDLRADSLTESEKESNDK